MKTAVEWLAEELCYITDNGKYIIDNTDDVTDIVNKAKEMEKEQLKKSYEKGKKYKKPLKDSNPIKIIN
jgi:hypothetical protein